MKKNTRAFRFTCYGLIAFLIVIIGTLTFLRPIFNIKKPQDATLIITATGQKQSNSAGTEVRIQSIKTNQSQNIDLKRLSDTQGWKMDGDLLVAYGVTKPVCISIPLSEITSIDIGFIKQRGSGIANVQIGDKKDSIDLYANEDWKTALWHYEGLGEFRPLSRIDLLLELWGVTFLVIWGFVYWRENKD